MREVPVPGEALSVVWRGTTPESLRGRLHAINDEAAVLEGVSSVSLAPGTEVMLVAGEVGHRQVAKGRYVGHRCGLVFFSVTTRFRPFDLRGQPRYAASAPAEVRTPPGNTVQRGRMLDISLGGVAVEVGEQPPGRLVEARLHLFGYSATLPCEVVGAEPKGGRIVLHLKFQALTHPQRAFVRNAIEHLANRVRLARAS